MLQTCAGQGMIFEELCYHTDFKSSLWLRLLKWCLILFTYYYFFVYIFLKEIELYHNSMIFVFVCCWILPCFSFCIIIWWSSWYYGYILLVHENLPPLHPTALPLPVERKLSVIIIGPDGSLKWCWIMGRPDREGKGEIIHWELNLPVIFARHMSGQFEVSKG